MTPPKRHGFGSRLVERGLAQDLGGSVEMRFEPSGLVCEVAAPLNEIVAKDDDGFPLAFVEEPER